MAGSFSSLNSSRKCSGINSRQDLECSGTGILETWGQDSQMGEVHNSKKCSSWPHHHDISSYHIIPRLASTLSCPPKKVKTSPGARPWGPKGHILSPEASWCSAPHTPSLKVMEAMWSCRSLTWDFYSWLSGGKQQTMKTSKGWYSRNWREHFAGFTI